MPARSIRLFAALGFGLLAPWMAQAEMASAVGDIPPAYTGAGKPLLVIRFNQRYVYFDRALTMAVQKAEQSRPGVNYDVISYVPVGKKEAASASSNLSNVVGMMKNLGVSEQRMHVSMQPADQATSQEIHVYVY